MIEQPFCGRSAQFKQYTTPVWEPLVAAVGPRLVGTFMWMQEEELPDGSALHAYKHIHTRRYLYLTEDGRAFSYAPCGGRLRMSLAHAIQEALCTWWVLSGWDAEDAEAVRDAVFRASDDEEIRKARGGDMDRVD
jgi:hypothetical protein